MVIITIARKRMLFTGCMQCAVDRILSSYSCPMSSKHTGRQMGLGSGRGRSEAVSEGTLKSALLGGAWSTGGSVNDAEEEEGEVDGGATASSSVSGITAVAAGEEWLRTFKGCVASKLKVCPFSRLRLAAKRSLSSSAHSRFFLARRFWNHVIT